MKRIAFVIFFSVSMLLSLVFSSCTTETDWDNLIDDFKNIDQSLVLPLGEATITLEDILNQLDSVDFIGSDESDMFVQYSDSLNWSLKDIALLGTTVPIQKEFYPSGGNTLPVPANTTFPFEFSENVNLGLNTDPTQQRIDLFKANSAKIKILINKENLDVNADKVVATISFENSAITFDNGATEFIHKPSAFGVEDVLTLPPFSMNTTVATGIVLNIRISITTNNQLSFVTPLSKLSFKLDFGDVDFKIAYGHFSPVISQLAQEQIVDLGDFQSNLPAGLFRLAEPSVKLTIKNNVGMRLGLNIEYVKAYRKNEPEYEPIYAQFKNNRQSTSIILNPAADYGLTETTFYTLDKDSGQIDRLFDRELIPNMLSYKFKVSNERKVGSDFITPDAKVQMRYDVKIPLSLKAGSYVEIKDTIENLNIDSLLEKDFVEKAILVLNVTNGIPVGAEFKIKLLQADGTPVQNTTIDSVFTLNAPAVDADGLVIVNQLAAQQIRIEVSKSQLSQLKSADALAFTLRVDRKDGKPIKFEKSNGIKVKVGVFVKAGASIDDLNNNE